MIHWLDVDKFHCLGISTLGKIWIRTDGSASVTGLYTCFDKTVKYTPAEHSDRRVITWKKRALVILNHEIQGKSTYPVDYQPFT